MPECITLNQTGKMILGEKLEIKDKIGTPSVYGSVFLVNGKGMGRMLKFAIKVMDIFNANNTEIHISKELSEDVQTKKFPHFPLIYGVKKCVFPPVKVVNYRNYYMVANELAQGDLGMFLSNSNPTLPQIVSCLSQIFVAVARLQRAHLYIHNDLHWGNVLYHDVKPGGYWKYKFNNETIYIRNTGQLWILWDFQKATVQIPPPNKNNVFTTDYQRIVNAFINRSKNGWVSEKQIWNKINFLNADKTRQKLELSDQVNLIDILADFDSPILNSIMINPQIIPSNVLNEEHFIIC
jgi:hypothetical protein